VRTKVGCRPRLPAASDRTVPEWKARFHHSAAQIRRGFRLPPRPTTEGSALRLGPAQALRINVGCRLRLPAGSDRTVPEWNARFYQGAAQIRARSGHRHGRPRRDRRYDPRPSIVRRVRTKVGCRPRLPAVSNRRPPEWKARFYQGAAQIRARFDYRHGRPRRDRRYDLPRSVWPTVARNRHIAMYPPFLGAYLRNNGNALTKEQPTFTFAMYSSGRSAMRRYGFPHDQACSAAAAVRIPKPVLHRRREPAIGGWIRCKAAELQFGPAGGGYRSPPINW